MDGSTGFKSGNEAQSLQDWLDGQRSRPQWPVLRGLIASLLDAIEKLHADAGVHGAISPHTIRVVRSPPHRSRSCGPISSRRRQVRIPMCGHMWRQKCVMAAVRRLRHPTCSGWRPSPIGWSPDGRQKLYAAINSQQGN